MRDGRSVAALIGTALLAGVVIWGLVVGERTDQDRVEALGARIRCPVCQGESIVDSPTPYAQDILAFVRERVDSGWTDDQILDYLEDRFAGIRLDPPFSWRTALLWLAPLAVAAGGAVAAARRLIGRRSPGYAGSDPATDG